MAEGRWLPWKEQKLDIRPFPDYKELAKPLKPPPRGLEWRRFNDGHWELQTIRKRNIEEEEEEDDNPEDKADKEEERVPEFLEHVVMPEDTLTGICMRYKVKERELRRLNDFVGDKFRMCDVLIVPNRFAAGQQPTQENTAQQPETQDIKLQRFIKKSMLSTPEAKYYLETNAWNVDRALAEWRAEKAWEIHHTPQTTTASQNRQPVAPRRRITSSSVFPAVAGTSINTGYVVASDGTIQLAPMNHYENARVPLLADVARP